MEQEIKYLKQVIDLKNQHIKTLEEHISKLEKASDNMIIELKKLLD